MTITEKQKNCPYCHDSLPKSNYHRGTGWSTLFKYGKEYLSWVELGSPTYLWAIKRNDLNADGTEIQIDYCPKCGRKLGDDDEK
ncbi:hypothetical protein [uncultured Lentilactobacillus sp.]|uniref:hypothetical protein n=1 Tax=uncultured Lentilactobacillus sp. TaxID=2805375 RepID=UPI0025981E55|nr:hypothetical protein [uncultured Lentilactobacillus sp.]